MQQPVQLVVRSTAGSLLRPRLQVTQVLDQFVLEVQLVPRQARLAAGVELRDQLGRHRPEPFGQHLQRRGRLLLVVVRAGIVLALAFALQREQHLERRERHQRRGRHHPVADQHQRIPAGLGPAQMVRHQYGGLLDVHLTCQGGQPVVAVDSEQLDQPLRAHVEARPQVVPQPARVDRAGEQLGDPGTEVGQVRDREHHQHRLVAVADHQRPGVAVLETVDHLVQAVGRRLERPRLRLELGHHRGGGVVGHLLVLSEWRRELE
jgi:hypothetical protein